MGNSATPAASGLTKKLPKLSIWQLINLVIGGVGLQFAWAMQINLTGRVTEPLGATPLLLGLIWLAGPISGILVQPVIGVMSDNMWTRFGRRRPFLLVGAILCALSLVLMPYSPVLLAAAASLWIIDICINVSMGPHRALVPDIMPEEQHAFSNSLFSFAVGLGAIIAFGFPYFIDAVFGSQISIKTQFLIAAIVLSTTMTWTCITTKEKYKPEPKDESEVESPFEFVKLFGISMGISAVITLILVFSKLIGNIDLQNGEYIINVLSWFILILSFPMLVMALKSFYTKEIGKICAMQYFTWLGVMCLFIYFNNYVVHNIFLVPDLTGVSEAVKASFDSKVLEATNFSGLGFAFYNLVCLIVSVPLGILAGKLGKKNVHAFSLLVMGLSFLGLGFWAKSTVEVGICIALAGVGWASILSIPYALLIANAPKGNIGSALGKFNLFIAGPQILSSIAVGYLINSNTMEISTGTTNHWEYAFIAGGISIVIGAMVSLTLAKEKAIETEDKSDDSVEVEPATV